MPKQLPKTSIFFTLEYTALCSSRGLSNSRIGKQPAFGKMHNQRIVVLVDSQAAIISLIKCTVTSITVFNCIRNLNQLGKQNQVSIAWIPGHARVQVNEVADYLAKSGSKPKCLVLNLLLQSRMPVVLARLRTGPQIDGDLCGINGKTAWGWRSLKVGRPHN